MWKENKSVEKKEEGLIEIKSFESIVSIVEFLIEVTEFFHYEYFATFLDLDVQRLFSSSSENERVARTFSSNFVSSS